MQEVERASNKVRLFHLMLWQVIWTTEPRVGRHAVGQLLGLYAGLLAKPLFIVGRNDELLKAEVFARRIEMGFADIGRLVASCG